MICGANHWRYARPPSYPWLAKAGSGFQFNEHMECEEGDEVFRHACKLGLEGIVSKRKVPATAAAVPRTGREAGGGRGLGSLTSTSPPAFYAASPRPQPRVYSRKHSEWPGRQGPSERRRPTVDRRGSSSDERRRSGRRGASQRRNRRRRVGDPNEGGQRHKGGRRIWGEKAR